MPTIQELWSTDLIAEFDRNRSLDIDPGACPHCMGADRSCPHCDGTGAYHHITSEHAAVMSREDLGRLGLLSHGCDDCEE